MLDFWGLVILRLLFFEMLFHSRLNTSLLGGFSFRPRDLERCNPRVFLSLCIDSCCFGSQTSLFGIQALLLRECFKPSLLACADFLLFALSASSLGEVFLALLFSVDSGLFSGSACGLCRLGLRLVIGLHRREPVVYVDLLLVQNCEGLGQ